MVLLPDSHVDSTAKCATQPAQKDAELQSTCDRFATTENEKMENKSTQTKDALFPTSMSTVIEYYDMLNRTRNTVCIFRVFS